MKHYKPTTPSRRHMSTVSYKKTLTTSKPVKSLTKGKKKISGRNSAGRITVRHKGGGHKRRYRLIDFKYDKQNIPAVIKTIEYDPNRSAFIASVAYVDGEYRYIVVPKNMMVGDKFEVSETAEIKLGNRLPLKNITSGTFVYNVELKPKNGAKLIRSAGTYAEVLANDAGYTNIKLPSGEVRKISENAWASIGEVSNDEYKLVNLGKAGRSRWLGIRPTVRGSAMNPVDHPHGGGEGRQGIGLRRGPKTREGRQAYGVKTRKVKKYSTPLIISRRKNKKRK